MSRTGISFFRLFFAATFFAAALVPAGAFAVPASPEAHVLVQPDGTVWFGSDDRKLYAVGPGGALKFAVAAGGAIRSSPAAGDRKSVV